MPFPKTPVQHQQTADQRIQDLLVGQMCDVWIIIRAQLGKDIPIKVLGGGTQKVPGFNIIKQCYLLMSIQNTNTITWSSM